MAKPTIRNINTRLRNELIPLELVRGDGYHYFVYDLPEHNVFETVSVYLLFTSHQSIDVWVRDARWAMEQLRDRINTRVDAILAATLGDIKL